MRFLKFKILVIMIASLALVTGCDKDTEEEASTFVGNFTIKKAMLAEALTIPIVPFNGMSSVSAPIGQDITEAIQNALLSSVACSTADKSWVELREDMSMYMSCEGTNALNAGTWDEVSSTELKLNMNSAAIPTSPTGFVLNVTNITQSATGMTGKTTVPLPKAMVAGLVAPLTLAATAPEVFMVSFSLEFVKK